VKRHFRTTLWEVHPITRLDVWQDSSFVNVDSLP
jgi:hypothetical protein